MQRKTKRRQLDASQQRRLAALIESRGESELAVALMVTRQTVARAAAGLALNSATHAVLARYLAP